MLAQVAGLPPLDLMEGFYYPMSGKPGYPPTLYHGIDTGKPAYGPDSDPYLGRIDKALPIKWECLKPSPLHELLHHSDCEGEIAADRCGPIADALEELIPLLPEGIAAGHIGNWREKTAQFVRGLRLAAEKGEPLDFH